MIAQLIFTTLAFANSPSTPFLKTDILQLSSQPEDYIAKSVETRAVVFSSQINHRFERIEIKLQGSGAPTLIVSKGEPLYGRLAHDLPSYGDRIEFRGTFHKFSNAEDFYILPSEFKKRVVYTFIVTQWSIYAVPLFFILFGILSFIARSPQQETIGERKAPDKPQASA